MAAVSAPAMAKTATLGLAGVSGRTY
jgi:hypothetical protein